LSSGHPEAEYTPLRAFANDGPADANLFKEAFEKARQENEKLFQQAQKA